MTGQIRGNPFSLSPAFCAHNGVIALSEGGGEVCLGMTDPSDALVRGRIERSWPGLRFRFTPVDRDFFALALSRLYAGGEGEGEPAEGSPPAESPLGLAEDDAPIVNLLNAILLEARSLGASDVHLESARGGAAVRFRVDGTLRPGLTLSAERAASLSARIKHLANLNIIETRRPQDGRMAVGGLGRPLDARVSIVPTVYGESVALRLLDGTDAPPDLDALGFSDRELARLTGAIGSRSGLILVTGPTGSGKTTTLSAILRKLSSVELKIVSIEDPVEYRLEGVTQIQTDDALSLSFDTLLRRIFRQDPDILMVGEIRDAETARLAARAALTGHLVFATLHATGALEAVPRILNLGVEPYVLAGVLRLSLAQRLVRIPCQRCGGAGCDRCCRTGYAGRTAISESVIMNPRLRAHLESGYSGAAFFALAKRGGFRPMLEDGMEKVARGITARDELLRELGR